MTDHEKDRKAEEQVRSLRGANLEHETRLIPRHADDDAALLETLDAARRELNEAHRELGRLRARVALLQRGAEKRWRPSKFIPIPEPETD